MSDKLKQPEQPKPETEVVITTAGPLEPPKPNPGTMTSAQLGEYLLSLKGARRTERDEQDRLTREARAKEDSANNEIDKRLRALKKLREAEESAAQPKEPHDGS